jgi:hypothetical protein
MYWSYDLGASLHALIARHVGRKERLAPKT